MYIFFFSSLVCAVAVGRFFYSSQGWNTGVTWRCLHFLILFFSWSQQHWKEKWLSLFFFLKTHAAISSIFSHSSLSHIVWCFPFSSLGDSDSRLLCSSVTKCFILMGQRVFSFFEFPPKTITTHLIQEWLTLKVKMPTFPSPLGNQYEKKHLRVAALFLCWEDSDSCWWVVKWGAWQQ